MNDERLPLQCFAFFLREISIQGNGMSPTKFSKHPDGEFFPKHILIGIVVTNCRDSAQEIADAAPPQPHIPLHLTVLRDRRTPRLVNVLCPFQKIPVASLSEAWEQCKFQVIVRVDQAWQEEKPSQIHVDSGVSFMANSFTGVPQKR